MAAFDFLFQRADMQQEQENIVKHHLSLIYGKDGNT